MIDKYGKVMMVVYASLSLLFILRILIINRTYDKSIALINRYCEYLIETNMYLSNINYYNEITMGFVRYIFSFWLWGKNSAIRTDYRIIMKNFEFDDIERKKERRKTKNTKIIHIGDYKC